jgi:hypothetical protein
MVVLVLPGGGPAENVTVHWPSGAVQGLGTVAAGEYRSVVEPAAISVDAGADIATDSETTFEVQGSVNGPPVRGITFRWRAYRGDSEYASNGFERSGLNASYQLTVAPSIWRLELSALRGNALVASDNLTVVVDDATPPRLEEYVRGPPSYTIVGRWTYLYSGFADNDPEFYENGTFQWTITGVEQTLHAAGNGANVTFARPGIYDATVLVSDPSGHQASHTYRIWVYPDLSGVAPPGATADPLLLMPILAFSSIAAAAACSALMARAKRVAAQKVEDDAGLDGDAGAPIKSARAVEPKEPRPPP